MTITRQEVTRTAVEGWMQTQLEEGEHFEAATREVDCTSLAEAAAGHFDHDEWLDDSDHWVWSAASYLAGQWSPNPPPDHPRMSEDDDDACTVDVEDGEE